MLLIQVEVPDDLVDSAMKYAPAGLTHEELICIALKAFIHVEASRRLAALGGTAPEMMPVPRRRFAED